MRRISASLLTICLLSGCNVAHSQKLDLKTHWDISTATQRQTVFRKKICLNGFWQFSSLAQPGTEPEGEWGYMKVPGGTRMQFVVHDAMRNVDEQATEKMHESPYALYRRTVRIPGDWKGRRISLYIAFLWHHGTIYVNGREITTIVPVESIAKRTVDITDALAFGEDNEIKILVANQPPDREERSDHNAGICDDIWLQVRPSGPRIDHLFVWTDVDRKKLHLRIRPAGRDAEAPERLEVSAALFEHLTREGKSGRKVLQVESQPLVLEDGQATIDVDLAPYWDELSLWNFENPALYDLVVDLAADGEAVDQVHERIGLRQTKIVGHKFYLNGHPCHVRDLYKCFMKDYRRRFGQFGDVRYLRRYFRMYKRAGWNLGHTFSAYEPYMDRILRVMDEEGLLYYPIIIGVSGYKAIEKDPEMFRKITEAVQAYGNHPCLILWSMFTTGNFRADADVRNPWSWTLTYGPMYPNKRSEEVEEGHRAFFEHMKACDPTRPALFGTGTNFGEAITGFYYPNFGTPIQEIESWPVKWHLKAGRKCHWTLESTFYYLACWADQSLFKGRGRWAEQVYENAARTLGPKAYTICGNTDPAPDIRPHIKEPRPGDTVVGKTIMHTGHNPVYLERMKEFVTRVGRAWRAYGTTCLGLGDELAIMFDVFRTDGSDALPVHVDLQLSPEQLKTPGPKVDRVQPYERMVNLSQPGLPMEAPPSDIYDEMRENATGPFLAFLSHEDGKTGTFTWKDHAYVSGEEIAKNVVLINDHAEPRTVRYQVRFANSVVKEGGAEMTPGEIRFERVAFEAPRVDARREYTLTLRAEIEPGQLAEREGNVAAEIIKSFPSTRTDTFAVQVYPDAATRIEAPNLNITLYDEQGRTRELLKEAGLEFTDLRSAADLDASNLVVVGRDSFTDAFRAFAAGIGLDDRLARGDCDMLIFEQSRSVAAFDRELSNAPARQVFPVDASHPVLAGISAADLRQWRGETDLQPSAPPVMGYYRPGTPYFPKWTNEGVVSSFPMLKPEYGNFRVLLDAWFDLGWTPLCEVFRNRGSVMFCQLDVTNDRFGTDPVATRMVRNLFAYYNQRAEGDKPALQAAVWCLEDDERARKLLDDRDVKYETFDGDASGGVLVLVGQADGDARIRDFVESGGTVLYLTDAEAGLDEKILPEGVRATPVEKLVYSLESDHPFRTPDPLLRGVSQSELHFKGTPEVLSIRGGDPLVADGVITRLDSGRGFYLFAPWIDVAELEGLRLMSAPKIERLYSTLLTNLGVAQGGIDVVSSSPPRREGRLLAKWDFETADRDGLGPFDGAELVREDSLPDGGQLCIKVPPVRKSWCELGISDGGIDSAPQLSEDVYVCFQYRVNKPTWLLVVVRADDYDRSVAKRIRVDEPGQWTTAAIRLDRFDGYPPTGLDGSQVSSVEFYAGDPGTEGFQMLLDNIALTQGRPEDDSQAPYVPLLKRCPHRYPYDPDHYFRW